jgi:hypothetical protein
MSDNASVMERRMTVPRYVIANDVEDSVVLLNLDTKRYYILNSTAGAIWHGVAEGKTESQIVGAMASEYDASREHISASVARIIDLLEKAHLIE